ncbi:hypothetical protein LTR08_001525 [Meristemomyces frigidus]|nr:hypothetical protein LTR08_001525 [Meristemomyces frigidus]
MAKLQKRRPAIICKSAKSKKTLYTAPAVKYAFPASSTQLDVETSKRRPLELMVPAGSAAAKNLENGKVLFLLGVTRVARWVTVGPDGGVFVIAK